MSLPTVYCRSTSFSALTLTENDTVLATYLQHWHLYTLEPCYHFTTNSHTTDLSQKPISATSSRSKMAATQSPNSQSPLNSTSSSIITTSASQSQTPPTTTNSSIITTSASQSQTPPTTTRSSTIEEPASKNQTPLALRVYSLPSSLFQSANNVKKAFHLEGKKEAGRGNRATEWTFRYRDGIKHTWKEQPMLTDNLKPITKVTKATRSSNPIKAPGPEGLNDFEWCHKYGANKWKSGFDQKAYYDNVFHIWKCNHCRNYDYGDDYATIPHLVDWEMKCALEGNWDGLSHMLTVPKKDNPAQQSGEMKPESMKPLKMWKWEWSLATRVFRQKQKHDEWKVKKMGGYVKAMGLREEWDEVAERRVEEVEKEDLEAASTMVTLASMAVESGVKKIESDTATLTASPTPTPAPTPKKRKRAAKEAESAPTAQSNGDELRRGKRARKATVPFNSLN